MKKILILLGGYLPAAGYGGPVTSISNLVLHMGEAYEMYIAASNHDFGKTEPLSGIRPGWNSVGNAKVQYLPDSERTGRRLGEIMDQIRPDLLYMSSIFDHRFNFPAQQEARKRGIPILLAPRGELDDGALRHSGAKKRAYCAAMRLAGAYRGMYFHTTCAAEAEAVKKRLKVSAGRVFCVPNLPAGIRQKERVDKESGSLRIMICARILPNKNQLLAIEAVNRLSFPVRCDLYGPVEDREYWELCQKAMETAPANVSFQYGGLLSPAQVGEELLRHDCFLLPTAFENYGHAISEALLHDCPPVISRGTTPWDWIEAAGCGYTVPSYRPEGFTEALRELGGMGPEAYQELLLLLRRSRDEKLSPEGLKKSYSEMFEKAAEKNG